MRINQSGQINLHYLFVIWLLSVTPVFAESAEFWIIENPSALLIYNQYEQRLSLGEKSAFSAFSAWQIIAFKQLLGDQYTHVIKTRYGQRIYFLQVSDKGELVNRDQAGDITYIKNATLLGDTIQIKTSSGLSLDSGRSRQKLSEGLLLKRMFQSGSKFFVRQVDGELNGWLLSSNPTDYEIYRVDKRAAAYQSKLFSQVNRIFQSYNDRFMQLFARLNQWYDKSLPPPNWQGTSSSTLLTYRLQPPPYQHSFPATRAYLVQELNDLLHGSDYTLVLEEAVIKIKKTAP